MIPTKRLSPLSFGYRVTSRAARNLELVVIVRGKFRIAPGAAMEWFAEGLDKFRDQDMIPELAAERLEEAAYLIGQGSLTGDVIDGDGDQAVAQLAYPSDFAEFKPRTDVMARGSCYPKGSATECKVGFGVGEFFKELNVVGPRVWVDKILGGKHTDPAAFKRIPIDYKHAFGGSEVPDNPVGRGAETKELPNVEAPGIRLKPAGFGPINPEWPLRRDKRGTQYGPKWEAERDPWYALDYDWTAQQAAPVDQQLDGYLRGDEQLRLVNMHPSHKELTSQLPGIRPRAFVMLTDDSMREAHLNLDTLFADVDEGVVYLTWRGHAPVKQDDLSDVKHLLIAHEQLNEAKKPGKHYKEQLQAFADDPFGVKDNPATALADLEKKAQSGELEKELEGMETEDGILAVLKPLTDKLPNGEEILEQLRAGAKSALAGAGSGGASLKQTFINLVKQGTDGAAAPRMVISDKGEASMGPMFKRSSRQLVQANKDAGGTLIDMEQIRDGMKASAKAMGLDEVNPDDFDIPESFDPPPPAPGADFSACDLSGDDFSGMDLTGCNFDGANLTQVNLAGAKLTGSTFRGTALTRVMMKGADLTECDFRQAHMVKSSLRDADLSRATLDQATLQKTDLAGAKLHEASASMMQVEKCRLAGLDATKATFDKCIFNECKAAGAKFEEAKLMRSFFRQCDLTKAELNRADLSKGGFFECNLDDAQLWRASGDTLNFQATSLRRTDLRHSDMPAANFAGVIAKGADFSAANMPKARLYRTVLRDAKLRKANLLQADLRKVVVSDTDFRGSNCYQAAFLEAHGVDADFRNANLLQANFKRSELVKKK